MGDEFEEFTTSKIRTCHHTNPAFHFTYDTAHRVRVATGGKIEFVVSNGQTVYLRVGMTNYASAHA
jgi:hypothetical protein